MQLSEVFFSLRFELDCVFHAIFSVSIHPRE
jgi:hypothetical protein